MLKRYLTGMAGILTMLVSLQLAADPNWKEARDVVENTTERVLALTNNKALQGNKNRDRLQAEIESIVTPVIDFYGFGRGVMGRFARQASEEELQRFASVLKSTLVRTYAIAMSDFSVRDYAIVPPRAASPQPDMQVVNVTLTTSANKTFNVLYYMRNLDGNWMLVNVMVDGINLRLQFQNQFAEAYQRSRSIAAVIDDWEERMSSQVAQVLENGGS